MDITPRQLVDSCQRRTATRAEAHFEVCATIESYGLPPKQELALKVACYRHLFPEHAHLIEPEPEPEASHA